MNVAQFPQQPPPPAEVRVRFTREIIAALMGRANAMDAAMRQSLLASQPINMGPHIVESLVVTMRALGLILDEFLATEDQPREIRLAPKDGPGNGRPS